MKKAFLFVLFFLTLFNSNSFAEFTFVQTKNVALDTPGIRGINFKPDGTIMYITHRIDNQKAYIIVKLRESNSWFLKAIKKKTHGKCLEIKI